MKKKQQKNKPSENIYIPKTACVVCKVLTVAGLIRRTFKTK